MIVPANNRFRISNKPWSVALANDITTDVSMDYPPFLGNYKGVVSSGLQGFDINTLFSGGAPAILTEQYIHGIPNWWILGGIGAFLLFK